MKNQQLPTFDVAVVGAGLVGASFALALADANLTVALIAREAPPVPAADASWDSRVYALSPGNAEWLQALRVWSELPPQRLSRVERMRIFGDRAPARLQFSAYDAGLRELAWIVENRLLQAALWSAVAVAPHVTTLCPAHITEIEWAEGEALIGLAGAGRVHARLVVGADGADSAVRTAMGVEADTADYGQLGVVANFSTAVPHEGLAFQWFRHDGVLALLPLPGKRVSMVWSTPESHARALLASESGSLERQLEAASGGVLGALEVITEPTAFPLRRLRVSRTVEPRAALIGDAAHAVHPLAGQGMNLGLRDARALAAVLSDRRGYRDVGAYRLLRRYERARAEDVALLDATTHGLQKLFEQPAVSLAAFRNFGLGITDALPPLKTLLVRHAAA